MLNACSAVRPDETRNAPASLSQSILALACRWFSPDGEKATLPPSLLAAGDVFQAPSAASGTGLARPRLHREIELNRLGSFLLSPAFLWSRRPSSFPPASARFAQTGPQKVPCLAGWWSDHSQRIQRSGGYVLIPGDVPFRFLSLRQGPSGQQAVIRTGTRLLPQQGKFSWEAFLRAFSFRSAHR